jgi:hypothetical protein
MAAQFLSRVEREVPQPEYSTVGPGTYKLPGTMRNSLPGFAPFSSNTSKISISTALMRNISTVYRIILANAAERMVYSEEQEGPAPGSYDVSKDLNKV